MRHRLNHLYLILAALMIGITGCTDTGDTQDAAQTDKDFAKTIGIADSLYNCMQFRDAYKLYLQLLDNKEAEADSEKRLNVLNALSNTSELSGHKVEQHKWLQQLHDHLWVHSPWLCLQDGLFPKRDIKAQKWPHSSI